MSSAPSHQPSAKKISDIFWKFFPFWMFLIFFKFAGGLHYSLISPLGERLMPLWIVGLLMGGTSIGLLLFDIPAGFLLDKYGYRRFLKITTITFLFAALCFAFGLTETTYLLSLLISIFGWLFYGPGVNAYILSHTPKEIAGRFISFRDIFGSIGIVLSSSVLPFVLLLSPQHIGYVLTGLFLISLIMIYLSPEDNHAVSAQVKISTHRHHPDPHFVRTIFKTMKQLNPASTMLLLLGLAASTFYGIIWFTVPLVIAQQTQYGELLGIGLGIFDFAVVALGFLLGNLADKANKRTLVFFGILIFSIAGMFLGFNFGWLFLLFGFLATSGDEMAEISLWSWLHSLEKDHDKDGRVAGVIGFFDDLGWSVGPMIAGVLYIPLGPSWTIFLGALPIFATWIFYQFSIRKHHKHHHFLSETLNTTIAASIPRKPHRARHRM